MAQLTAAIGQRALYAALGAVAALLLVSFVTSGGDSKNTAETLITVARLKEAGWAPAHGTSPLIKDRPRGARPVAVVQGAVRYPALEPGKVPGTDVDAVPPSRSLVPGTDPLCDLDQITATVNCRAEIIELDGIPAARLFVAGRLELSQKVRELPEVQAQDVRLEMAPIKRPRRFGWTVGVGGGYDPISRDARVVLGAMWGVRVR